MSFAANETLSEKINKAANGETIILDSDCSEKIVIPNGKNITLNLNGKKVTPYGITVENGATVKITGNGTVDAKEASTAALYVEDGGNATVENGTFSSYQYYCVLNHGTAVVNNGIFKQGEGNKKNNSSLVDNGYYEGKPSKVKVAKLTINGGTVVAEGHDSQSIAIGGGNEYASNAIININGGMITAISDGSNGTAIGFYSSVDSKYNSQSPLDGKIYFSGGTVVAKLVDSSTNSPIDLVKLFNGNVYNGNLEIYEDGNLATTLSETNDGNGHRQYTYSGAYTAPTEPTNLIDNLDTSNLKNVIGTVKQAMSFR